MRAHTGWRSCSVAVLVMYSAAQHGHTHSAQEQVRRGRSGSGRCLPRPSTTNCDEAIVSWHDDVIY